MNVAQIANSLLPGFFAKGIISADEFRALTGKDAVSGARVGRPGYEVANSNVFVKSALSWSSKGEDILLDENTDYNQGVASPDKGKISDNQYQIISHVKLAWGQHATFAAQEIVFGSTRTDIEQELLNAELVVYKNGKEVASIPVTDLLPQSDADRPAAEYVALPNPILYKGGERVKVSIKYALDGGNGAAFTANTFAEVRMVGPRFVEAPNQ